MSDRPPPKTSDVLPPLYARWMDELLQADLPPERASTCLDCAMCIKGRPGAESGDGAPLRGPAVNGAQAFDPAVKCCTYVPKLPNFLVGGVLDDEAPESAEGRATMVARIAAGIEITPLGVGTSPAHDAAYDKIADRLGFGRDAGVRCPHLLSSGLCGIHRYRDSVCSTFFCKKERGAVAEEHWQATKKLLGTIEHALALWCALQLGLDADALQKLHAPYQTDRKDANDTGNADGRLSPRHRRAIWGSWLGREEEFYRKCFSLVRGLRWSDVVRICGVQTQAEARIVQRSFDRITRTHIPSRLEVGVFTTFHMDAQECRVCTYDPLDAVALPRALVDVLYYFDGGLTEVTVARIENEAGVVIDEELLQMLVDFWVLVEP